MTVNLQSIKQRFGIIGNSPALDNALMTAVKVASTDLTVLITGESGVGKEVFSKIIHELSPRRHNNFIAVNCGAIPEGTINSELFGHEKGAFTGATEGRKGYFETVDGGTIFLDEVGEMPLETQTRLLRVLEQGEFIKVGSSKVQKTNVRVIGATNVDMREQLSKGKFRDDLFYRLSTVPISVPPLKERKEDIYLLFRKFASDYAERYRTEPLQLDEEARYILENYAWQGNIRELKNVAEQLSLLSPNRKVGREEFLNITPHLFQRYLPIKAEVNGSHAAKTGEPVERELMFKFLYDMKKDINDLKTLLFEMVRMNHLRMPVGLPSTSVSNMPDDENQQQDQNHNFAADNGNGIYEPITPDFTDSKPRIIESGNRIEDIEEVVQSMSLEEMEKYMIEKALKKHKGKRKEAAFDLGISERTLYRKIKQYSIEE